MLDLVRKPEDIKLFDLHVLSAEEEQDAIEEQQRKELEQKKKKEQEDSLTLEQTKEQVKLEICHRNSMSRDVRKPVYGGF